MFVFEVGVEINDCGLLKLLPVIVLISKLTLWKPLSLIQVTVSPTFIVKFVGE